MGGGKLGWSDGGESVGLPEPWARADGAAAKILAELGADPARVHQEVARLLRAHGIEPDDGTTRTA